MDAVPKDTSAGAVPFDYDRGAAVQLDDRGDQMSRLVIASQGA